MRLAFFLCIVALAGASSVTSLTASTFNDFIASSTEAPVLVEFYAPWCGHCKRLEPEYAKAAEMLAKGPAPHIRLGKVDATEEVELGQKYASRGYPTLLIWRNGVQTEYEGPRDAEGIVKFMRKQAGPSARPLRDGAELKAYLAEADDVTVVHFGKAPAAFTRVADRLRDKYRFAEVGLAEPGRAEGSVVLFQAPRFVSKHDAAEVELSLVEAGDGGLEAQIAQHHLPLVGERTADRAERYAARQAQGHHVVTVYGKVDYDKDPSGSNYLANRVRRAALKHRGRLTFAVASKEKFRGELAELDLAARDVGVGARGPGGEKYRMAAEWSPENLAAFAEDLVEGRVEPFVKSEDEPAGGNAGPVKVLTARSFNTHVTAARGAFVYFYAPWCGHCKTLAPKFEALGEELQAHHKSVLVAKFDATANDLPTGRGVEVRGYPTIYFFPRGGGQAVKYDGERETGAMKEWVLGKIGGGGGGGGGKEEV
jgi:protein disulfide isomerase family A protein 3